jgi:hypothetical protein
VFEVSGTIRANTELEIRNPYITIAGQTAPAPGITLRGAGLLIMASDVLVQHLTVRVGDDPNGPPPENRDALRIESFQDPIKNIVVDHCSFSWSLDEMVSIFEKASNVSLLNNIFAEPLHDSLHPDGPHGYGVLIGAASNQVSAVSLVGNLMAHQLDRNPLSLAQDVVLVNNLVYNAGREVALGSRGATDTRTSIVGNVFVRGPNSDRGAPVTLIGSGPDALGSGTQVYLADNLWPGSSSDATAAAWAESPLSKSSIVARSAPAWPNGLAARATSGNGTLNQVLATAGARPASRDAVDLRIVAGVRNNGGQSVNCVADDGSARCGRNAGGWPALTQRTRALALPQNPNQIASDGYSNLEKWLHGMAAQVEGRAVAPAAPKANVQ